MESVCRQNVESFAIPKFDPDISLSESAADLNRIKKKISSGIPRHPIHTSNSRTRNQNLDVDKIATSDDLINFLADDYRNETTYVKRTRENEQHEEDSNDAQHADINEYLKSIAALTYEESYENYINCMVCLKLKTLFFGLN